MKKSFYSKNNKNGFMYFIGYIIAVLAILWILPALILYLFFDIPMILAIIFGFLAGALFLATLDALGESFNVAKKIKELLKK